MASDDDGDDVAASGKPGDDGLGSFVFLLPGADEMVDDAVVEDDDDDDGDDVADYDWL